jgi:hypothetical protein
VPGDKSQSSKKAGEQLKTAMAQGRLDHRTGQLCIYGLNVIAAVNNRGPIT